jgi:hypothetical protein
VIVTTEEEEEEDLSNYEIFSVNQEGGHFSSLLTIDFVAPSKVAVLFSCRFLTVFISYSPYLFYHHIVPRRVLALTH